MSLNNEYCNSFDHIKTKRIIITGGAGFIGFHLARKLLQNGVNVIAVDNINDYYDTKLKEDRLNILTKYNGFSFIKEDISNKEGVNKIFHDNEPDIVINLAAQAGVRYSFENPDSYIKSNIIGFFNILEACKNSKIEHLIFASSSSVYGANKKTPFSTNDKTDCPISLYAATKKANEALAYSYSNSFGLATTGLRFFTVYGPYGRPDMAYFSFTNNIIDGKPIKVFNSGNLSRDFTYIDDIVEGIIRIIPNSPKEDINNTKFKVYNIGNNQPVKLLDFINTLEKHIGKVAEKEFVEMQRGDVYTTYADITEIMNDFGFRPSTSIDEGIMKFIAWYKEYYPEKFN